MCSCLPLPPGLACSNHATWGPPFSRARVPPPAMYDSTSSRRGHKGMRRGEGRRPMWGCGQQLISEECLAVHPLTLSQSIPPIFAHQKCQSRPKLEVQFGHRCLCCHNSIGNKNRRVTFIECFLPLLPVAFGIWATPPVTRQSIFSHGASVFFASHVGVKV